MAFKNWVSVSLTNSISVKCQSWAALFSFFYITVGPVEGLAAAGMVPAVAGAAAALGAVAAGTAAAGVRSRAVVRKWRPP